MPPNVDVAAEKKKVVAFLQTHDPTKVGLADELLKRFVAEGPAGMEKMWSSLRKRYNVAESGGPASPSASVKSPLASSAGASSAPPKSGSAAGSPKAVSPGGKATTSGSTTKPAAASPTKSAAKEKPVVAAAAKAPKKVESPPAKEEPTSSSAEKPEKKASAANKKQRASVVATSPPARKGGANDDSGNDEGPVSATVAEATSAPQKERLRRYFQKHLPDRLPQLDAIAERVSAADKKTGTAWSELWTSLTSKFGPEDHSPSEPSAASTLVAQKSVVSSILSPRGGGAHAGSSSSEMASAIPKSLHSFVQFPPQQQQHGNDAQSPRWERSLGSNASSVFSPGTLKQSADSSRALNAAPSVSEADLQHSDGQTMTTQEDRRRKEEELRAETQQWVDRLSRYFQHYDPTKTEDDIRSAVAAAQQTPNGLQQLWEALVQHYGPEPPQPIAKMFQLLSASNRQRVATPQDVAKALILSTSSVGSGGSAVDSSGTTNSSGSAVPPDKSSRTAAAPTTVGSSNPNAASSSSSGAAATSAVQQQKKKWYLEEDDATHPSKLVTTTLPIVGPREFGKPSSASSLSAGADGTPYDVAQRSQVSGVGAATTILFGVLRFVGLDYRLYESATETQRYHFIRAIEQELSYNMDCDPSAITVRRIIPNTAVDFKIDLTEAVRRGSQSARNAQHMGDVLVNRVLNGTLSLRLVRDSYRRDLGGVASAVYPQSCAVFGNESQQYYSLVPDELPSAPLPPGSGGAVADSRYAAFAAAPPSTQHNPRDVFGTPPHVSNAMPPPVGSLRDDSRPDVDAFASRLHHMAELELSGKGMGTTHAAAIDRGATTAAADATLGAAGVRPSSRAVVSGRPNSAVSGHHDFGSRVWDDDASEIAEYGRREETAQYTFHKPERISASSGWNRLLESFADPNKTVLDTAGLRGARFVQGGSRSETEQYRQESAYLPEERRSPTHLTGHPSKLALKGLEAVRSRSSPNRPRTFGGGGGTQHGGAASPRAMPRHQAPRASSPRERSTERSPRTQWMYKSYDRTSPPPSSGRLHTSPPRADGSHRNPHRSPYRQILTDGNPPRLLEPQVRSTAHHGPPTSADEYRGFGRDVPAIRERAVGGGVSSSEYFHPPQSQGRARHVVPAIATYGADMYNEPHAVFMEREGQRRQAINVETVREPRWPADSFSREYHRIMSS